MPSYEGNHSQRIINITYIELNQHTEVMVRVTTTSLIAIAPLLSQISCNIVPENNNIVPENNNMVPEKNDMVPMIFRVVSI